jgi:hypothetical protein
MDESKPSISPGKFRLRSASGWISADIDPPPAEFDQLASLAGAAVYYRNDEEVSRGFLIALGAMGIAPVEQSPKLPKPFGAAHAQKLNDRVVHGAALSVETSRSTQEN